MERPTSALPTASRAEADHIDLRDEIFSDFLTASLPSDKTPASLSGWPS
jgi:hypothetical protein